MKTEIIERKGKSFAVVPLRDYQQLVEDARMLEDVRTYDSAKRKREEAFPADVADRLVAGESPIRVFRDFRGKTQQQLATSARISRPYLAELEAGRKKGSVAVLRAVAKALGLELDDIAG